MKIYPEPTVGAFILNGQGKLLLVQSHKWKDGLWHVPGGHIEWGESIEDAVKREVKEEVGLDVQDIEVFHLWEAIFPKSFSRKKHFLFIECLCRSTYPRVIPDTDEIQNAQWFSFHETEKLGLEDFTKKSIALLKKR